MMWSGLSFGQSHHWGTTTPKLVEGFLSNRILQDHSLVFDLSLNFSRHQNSFLHSAWLDPHGHRDPSGVERKCHNFFWGRKNLYLGIGDEKTLRGVLQKHGDITLKGWNVGFVQEDVFFLPLLAGVQLYRTLLWHGVGESSDADQWQTNSPTGHHPNRWEVQELTSKSHGFNNRFRIFATRENQ